VQGHTDKDPDVHATFAVPPDHCITRRSGAARVAAALAENEGITSRLKRQRGTLHMTYIPGQGSAPNLQSCKEGWENYMAVMQACIGCVTKYVIIANA